MKLGLIFTGDSLPDLVRIAARAEANGFSTLAMAEAWRSCWVPLTAMAAATSTIRLAPYVTNAYGHSPLMTGMAAVDFNAYCGGRLLLGVGGGNRIINEQWQGIPHARVLTKMHEYVACLQQMARTLPGQTVHFQGQVHQMDWSPAVEPGAHPFPVYLAAVFPRMVRVAAQVADGVAGGATLSPAYIRDVLRPMLDGAAADADRDPAALPLMNVVIAAAHPDRERARHSARQALCHLYAPLPHPYYEFTMREQGFGAIADRLLELVPAGDIERACDAISDACLDQLTVCGTPAECRERLSGYTGLVEETLLLNASPPGEDGTPISSYDALLGLAAA